MSYASEVSRLNDDVDGASGRKFRGGRILTAFEETFPANVGSSRDIAFDPSTGTFMIVGKQMVIPNNNITILLRDPVTSLWSFKPGLVTDPAFGLGGGAIAANNGRYIISTFATNPGPVLWWTDDLGNTYTAGVGSNQPATRPFYVLPTNDFNNIMSGRDGGVTFKSADNGKNWNILPAGGNGDAFGYLNESGNIHAIYGNPPASAKSVNGGASWAAWASGTVGWSNPLGIAWNGLLGGAMVVVGDSGAAVPGGPKALVAVTHDAGQNVTLVANPRNISLFSICLLPNGTFLAAGADRGDGKPYVVLGSIDGLVWKDITVPTARLSNIDRVRFLNGRVWFVGSLGGIANGCYSMHPSAFFF